MLPDYRYPSDTSDTEWLLLEQLLPVPACQTPKGGAPEKWPRRRVVDAIRYITDNGAKWRALPTDFGIPWRTVFGYFARGAKAGALKRILDQLRRRLRLRCRRCPWPVRVIVDSQSEQASRGVALAPLTWPCRWARRAVLFALVGRGTPGRVFRAGAGALAPGAGRLVQEGDADGSFDPVGGVFVSCGVRVDQGDALADGTA
ncbi:transposase [Streptomyces avermitilis]|uniref:transposase n=1 Tax=Streptomyces avermitilis TaxID=33903 RepID=UPI0033AF72D2